MHDIWNPWHGCKKCSEGCDNCYMYFLDKVRGQNGGDIYKTKNGFNYPLQRNKNGSYKVKSGEIEQVICSGENYDGARICDFSWVLSLREECVKYDVTFCFIETGTKFRKDGKVYNIPKKSIQSRQAYKSKVSYIGKPMEFKLTDNFGLEIPKEDLYIPFFGENCKNCGSKIICNGCANCGKCEDYDKK